MSQIIVAGACGRMGTRILALASQDASLEIVGAFEYDKHASVGKTLQECVGLEANGLVLQASIAAFKGKMGTVIDFTHASAVAKNVELCEALGFSMVIGTTGLDGETQKKIEEAAKKIAIVQAPNMSLGVNLLFVLAEMVSSKLKEEYDIEIVEAHHKHKKDAPSGTALELAHSCARGRGVDLDKVAVYGRQGMTGEREAGTIGIHAVRGGDVVGEHDVNFLADGEMIALRHRASSRDAFAKGALRAAKFLNKKTSGFYTMKDVLGLN